ncbi:hypothetical protein BV372_11865 [Nostoc sp. T09]|uniref:glycosyltransferase family 4 protein n=1 Tax=Nostoc sp. T09 TaxID=1932621 RepID=UPI000A3BF19B|nr:glycosyltransferase family 4 protein [Nostoc sp. T09]OUL35216.1 hypothetical protein BV372_11865 [Nostoc sp. T09]
MGFSNLLYSVARRGKALLPQKIKNKITQKIIETRSASFSEVGDIERFNPSLEDLQANEEVTSKQEKYFGEKITSATWFVPYIPFPYYGGIFTIYRFCNYLISKGIKVRLSVRDCPQAEQSDYAERICKTFPNLDQAEIFFQKTIDDVSKIPDSDISFATDWPSAYSSLSFNRVKIKYYFIQDYEPLCYQAGAISGLAELTYHLGFIPIINTQGLYEYYSRRHNPDRGVYFNPSVDRNIFHYEANRVANESLPTRIFYYCRPNSGRNGFSLGISTLKRIKEKWEDRVDIVLAGSVYNDPLLDQYPNHFSKLGLLPYENTGSLYRRCHIGLVTMYTPHTSYLPLELMACGVCVVTNKSDAKDWLIQDNYNGLYSKPIISELESKIDRLIENPNLRKEISNNGVKFLSNFSWDDALEKVYMFLTTA